MRNYTHYKSEESVVNIHLALKLNKLGYWEGDGTKMGWFKIGRRWELLEMTEVNILRARKFIFAPTLENTIKWLEEKLGIWPEVADSFGKFKYEPFLLYIHKRIYSPVEEKELTYEFRIERPFNSYKKAIEEGIKISIEFFDRVEQKPRN